MYRLTLILILFLILFPLCALAKAFSLEVLNKEKGLCSSSVTAITQTSSGIILIGTEDGLCEYDGKKFINHKKSNNFSGTVIPFLQEVAPEKILIQYLNYKLDLYEADTKKISSISSTENLKKNLESRYFSGKLKNNKFYVGGRSLFEFDFNKKLLSQQDALENLTA